MYLIYGENRGRNRISPEEDWVTVVIRASDVQNQQIMLSRPKGQQAIGPVARQASLLSTNSIQFMPKKWFAKRCKGESPRETPNKTHLKKINIYIDKHGNKTHQKLGFFSFTTFYRFDFFLSHPPCTFFSSCPLLPWGIHRIPPSWKFILYSRVKNTKTRG